MVKNIINLNNMVKEINRSYVTDEAGNKTAVQISYQDWIDIENKLSLYFEYIGLKDSLENAFKEVLELKKNKQSRISLNDFLNEC